MWIDITNYGVHKGTTVQKLQSLIGVTKAETIAFGDGYNDFEMFEEASKSFAMENSFDGVKEKANYVAPSNDDNGVLITINLLLGEI